MSNIGSHSVLFAPVRGRSVRLLQHTDSPASFGAGMPLQQPIARKRGLAPHAPSVGPVFT